MGDWWSQGKRPILEGEAPTAHASSHVPGASDPISLLLSAFLGMPAAADDDAIVTSVNLTNTTLTLAGQPDVPRNITITVTDTTPGITAGTVTVTGQDAGGVTVTETLDLSSALTLTGTKIFGKVTSAAVAGATALGGAGDETIKIGWGNKIGLPTQISASSAVKHVYLGGVRQATPTIATGTQTSSVDASSGTYNGSKVLHVFFDIAA